MNISFIKRIIFFMLLYPVIVSGVNVTFQVDMTNETVDLDCPPTISGSFFSNWSWFQTLSQVDGFIWATTLNLNPDEYHEFKFGNCEWNLESLAEGSPCTNTNYGYTNRYITVPNENTTLEPVLYGSCENSEGGGYEEGWVLVWSDEFDGPEIDESKWDYDIGTGDWGWGNGEAQYYTNNSSNSFIENGHLVIQALLQNYGGANYTSARMVTRDQGDWTYGRIEVRAKLPGGVGTWPAIWMLPTDWVYGGWPYSGEIDIMEHVGFDPNVIHGTAHTEVYNWWNGTPPPEGTMYINGATSSFHDYTLEWDKDYLKWYVDDVQYFTYANDQEENYETWPFDQRFHLLLNIAIGGTWGGQQGIDDDIFPVHLEVDYVRVYQQRTSVTFQVDMSNETVNEGVFLNGSFVDWDSGSFIEMTDEDEDNIYSATVSVPQGYHLYQYFNGGGWENREIVPPECDVNDHPDYADRGLDVAENDITLDPVCFGSCGPCTNSDYLMAYGSSILDPDQGNFILKGMGLGGWLVPEGYMLKIPGFGSPTEIRNMITDLVGTENSDNFYEAYRDNFVTEEDISQLAEWGFNSVRLPFHYKLISESQGTYSEDGFQIIDQLLDWCSDNEMYLILDMHCAPGGQNPNNISDSNGEALLWVNDTYKEWTADIWGAIAQRYSTERWIGGYDLLNEPAYSDNSVIRQVYEDISNAVRMHDTNHIIFIEGNWYGSDFYQLVPPFDNNMVYSFHWYWSESDQDQIASHLNMRNQYNVPLWMGESGENSNHWYNSAVQSLENNNIGWCWWTYKKMRSITSPLETIIPQDYQLILDFWEGNGPEPNISTSVNGLMDMADSFLLDNCIFHPGVIQSLMDGEFGDINKPFSDHILPGTIMAVDYDIGGNETAYVDEEYETTSLDNWVSWNQGWFYRNDGVDIEECDDPEVVYNVGWITDDEWLKYTISALYSDDYEVSMYVAGQGQGTLQIKLDSEPILTVNISPTGGWQNWEPLYINMYIPEGEHELSLHCLDEGFNLSKLVFSNMTPGMTLEHTAGWNMVGLPLIAESTNAQDLFPESVNGSLYGFNGTYFNEDGLAPGTGYWLNFYANGSSVIQGESITELTIALSQGWNLISGISDEIPVSGIIDPDNIIVEGTIYGFQGAYINTEIIEPGKAYWIYSIEDGTIELNSTLSSVQRKEIFSYMSELNKMTINGIPLYFGRDIPYKNKLSYRLPPLPPSGAFDVRFNGGTKITTENKSEIEVMSPYKSLNISYDVILNSVAYHHWVLTSTNGEEYILEGTGGEITVPSSERFTLEHKATIPTTFTLHQNFPNPFNPITTLRYDLPIDNFVILTVHDMLGRMIVQLVGTTQGAGFKSVEWDGTDHMGRPVSAGVYLYRIQSGEFVQTKKMVLVK